MAAVLVVVGTARLSASGAPNARAATTVTKFDANGAAAFVSFATITCEGFVSVARGGSSKAPETFVAYVVIDRLTGLPIEEGQGVIPNEAFAASKTSAQLTVDTSTVPNFIFSTGDGIPINVTWSTTGSFVIENTGTTVLRTPTSRLTDKGSSVERGASANGTVGDFTLQDVVQSSISESAQKTMTVERT